jgi:hypothetical protein
LEVGPLYLSAQHRDLMAQHEQLDIFRAVVAGKLGQHLRYVP